jgi:hypothetical protein
MLIKASLHYQKPMPMRCLLLMFFVFLSGAAGAQGNRKDAIAIQATLSRWNNAIRDRNISKALSVFDSTRQVLLVGSDSAEVFPGYEGVRRLLTAFFSGPDRAYFDLGEPIIQQQGTSAWMFVSGGIIVQEGARVISRTPYRISIVLIKKGGAWKWTLFHGSSPVR